MKTSLDPSPTARINLLHPPIRRGLFMAMFFSMLMHHAVGQKTSALNEVETNKMIELVFISTSSYADPFNEVTLDVIFKNPQGNEIQVPAFWAGDNKWKVRYSSPVPGSHTYRSVCSNSSDGGLNNQSGTITVKKYSGSNMLYQHGAIKVAADKHHFAYADNTPFFWLADTWWMGLTSRLHFPDEVKILAENRVSKGYNVIQIVAGLYPDMPAFDPRGANEAGFPWDTAYRSINPAYFDAADHRIQFLADEGLVPCIVGAWGYHLPWLGTEKIKQHWRYLIARWGALPVVWCAAGETTMPYYLSKDEAGDAVLQKAEWTKVIQYMRQTDGFHRMITTHPNKTARESLLDPSLLDFDMHQTGHGSDPMTQSGMAFKGWNTTPVMPVISGESEYEALEIPLPIPAAVSRKSFWANAINAGFAGHTYGGNGIWQVNRKEKPYGNSPGGNNWGTTPWDVTMNLPGSMQIAQGSKFLQSLPSWNHFEPHPEMIISWSGKDTALYATAGKTSAFAYILTPGSIRLRLPEASTTYKVSWFDPVKGEVIMELESVSNDEGMLTVTSPDTVQDWGVAFTKK